jgi:hypothetical protein
MTREQTGAVVEAIERVLEDAALTVDELTQALVEACGAWAADPVMPAFQGMWPRWRQITDLAANRGVLCFGPNRGRNVTYTSPRRWMPGLRPADGPAALASLVRHYLHAYGPATPQQFAQWLAAPRGWATQLFDSLGDQLERVEVEGQAGWVAAGDTRMPSAAPRGVRLLPYFDAYAVGCHPRDLLFPGKAGERALATGQGGQFPVLLVEGIVAGVWHQRRAGKTIEIKVEPVTRLSAANRRALEEQAARVGEFLEGVPRLTLGKVTVGAHA